MSDKDLDLGDLTAQIAGQIRRRSKKLPLAPHQTRALRIIVAGDLRPARLAEQLGVTPRAVTDVVDALTDQGLVSTGPDPADRRAKVISASTRGHDYLEATRAARAEISAEMFGVLSPSEQDTLRAMLERVLTESLAESAAQNSVNSVRDA